MALTALTVSNALPSEVRREIADDIVRGLRLSIQPTGAKSWVYRFRMAGRARKLTIGPVSDALMVPTIHVGVAQGHQPSGE